MLNIFCYHKKFKGVNVNYSASKINLNQLKIDLLFSKDSNYIPARSVLKLLLIKSCLSNKSQDLIIGFCNFGCHFLKNMETLWKLSC